MRPNQLQFCAKATWTELVLQHMSFLQIQFENYAPLMVLAMNQGQMMTGNVHDDKAICGKSQ